MKYGQYDIECQTSIQGISLRDFGGLFEENRRKKASCVTHVMLYLVYDVRWI